MQNLTKNSKTKIIAVDGEPAAGKGTLAKGIAKHFDMLYMDTGAMFRAVGLYFLENNIEITNNNIESNLKNINITLKCIDSEIIVILNNEEVTNKIRGNKVTMAAKIVSQNKFVRKRLIELQRNIARNTSCVVDGQDIGTIVFPNANIKIFLVANIKQRAIRRKSDFEKKGENISFEKVKNDLIERTHDDYTRVEAPLKKAEDAYLIDNSDLSKEETLNQAIKLIEKGLNEK